ncbi:hypothetical protein KBX35_05275 [Micromonospora sp. C32]|uniref:hypothetical protein n=1 Tax=Micromonospora sp. C32 TaxID=2824877 RepID=UPI001B37A1CE|nr:hypothetical protein [Micromonospora sp. C32]MBQ1054200.1 hypothetical protein [Micromonospora sp. C32]
MTNIRATFTDVKPFHRKPIGLRFSVEAHIGTPFQAPHSVLRVHGDFEETSNLLTALALLGFAMNVVDIAECSPRNGCLHSLSHGPASLTDEHLKAALQVISDNT